MRLVLVNQLKPLVYNEIVTILRAVTAVDGLHDGRPCSMRNLYPHFVQEISFLM
jgi:hypothetical protein